MTEFKLTSSKTVYQGRSFNFQSDTLQTGDMSFSIDYIDHSGGVTVVPLDDNDHVLMVRQYRHPVQSHLLELPAGTVGRGEDFAMCAARELQEEVGMAPSHLQLLGECYLAPGYSSELMHIYLATGLVPSSLPQDDDEAITMERVPFADAVRMALTGEIRDAKSIAGLLLAVHKR